MQLKAMLLISNKISRGEFDALRGLVADNSIEVIRANYARLSSQQQSMIAAREDDIQSVMFHLFETAKSHTEGSDSTFVKIGVVFQVLPGIKDLLEQTITNPQAQLELIRKLREDSMIADYRYFIFRLSIEFLVPP